MDPYRILFVLRLPARLTVTEIAILLGFHVDGIRNLVKIGLLDALGETEGVELMFDGIYADGLRRNPKWKEKATNAERARVRTKNDKQKENRSKKKEPII